MGAQMVCFSMLRKQNKQMRFATTLGQSVMQRMVSPSAGDPFDMRLVDGLTFDRMLY